MSVLHAYWDKLGKAHRLYAKFTIPNPAEGRDESFDCWLEKPSSMRLKGPGLLIRSDGKTTWIENTRLGTKREGRASPDDIPPALEPFFNRHRWDAAGWSNFEGRKQCVMLSARSGARVPSGIHIYLNPETRLPLGTTYQSVGQSYLGRIRLLQLDPPTISPKHG